MKQLQGILIVALVSSVVALGTRAYLDREYSKIKAPGQK